MKRALSLALLLAGCSAPVVPPPRWDTPDSELNRLWDARRAGTHQSALLAVAEYKGPPQDRTFTLELFYRQPQTYLLRGRGTLGVEGFRALLNGDSITVLMDRQKRGFSGPAAEFPDSSTRELWLLLESALPWIVGEGDLNLKPHRIQTAQSGTRPQHLRIEQAGDVLDLDYTRYREDYPYWHLSEIRGRSASASLRLEVRQQLYNPTLDSGLFRLTLPPGTQSLLD